MRTLLEARGDGFVPSESTLELLLTGVMDEVPGLRGWRRQARFEWWERGKGRFDVTVDWLLAILEADGRRWHTRVDDFERDRWRDNVAQAHGYDVLRFTHRQLTVHRGATRRLLERYVERRRGDVAAA